MLRAGEARCAVTPMNGMTVLRRPFMQRQRNGEEPNDKRRKDTSFNTRSVNLLGAS
jgi:hypothetical protein